MDIEEVAALGAAVSRVSSVGGVLLLRDRRPGGVLPNALVLAWGAMSSANTLDILLTRRHRSGWILLDTALCVATNLATAKRSEPGPARWGYHQAQSLVVATATTAGFSPLGVGAVVLAAGSCLLSGIVGRERDARPERTVLAPVLELLATALGLGIAAHQLRRFEAEVERLEEQARDHAAAAAVEAERARQHRLLHDTVLQTLEGIAGDWPASNDQLRQLAAADAARLRNAIAGDDDADDLPSGIKALVRLFRGLGLDVDLDITDLDRSCSPAATEALTAATREALQNALKHAGPCTVRVVAGTGIDSTAITIRDDGAGFDPSTVAAGFGLTESIRARMASVSGTAEVESEPGVGTVVALSAPLR